MNSRMVYSSNDDVRMAMACLFTVVTARMHVLDAFELTIVGMVLPGRKIVDCSTFTPIQNKNPIYLYKLVTLCLVMEMCTVFREHPYPLDYPMRRLTMEDILAKFIDEGRRKHEEMEIFIKEFRTTNELLLKTRSNLLSELKIEVNELSKVVSNVLIPKNEVKGLTTRGGKMMSEASHSKKINEIGFNKKEPPRFEQDVQEKPHDDGVKNKSSSIHERTTQPLVKLQQSAVPFPNRV
ncbi:hypothetical protein Tco_1013450 [Tanacetum coccineum]